MEVEKMKYSLESNTDDQDNEGVLPGFRFHPTDEELVGFYLRRKVEKKPLSIEIIKALDIYQYDPWDLPKMNSVDEKECYYFCRRGRKYKNSVRPNRVTGSGFWKATGIDRPIYAREERRKGCIGLKKSLVYYRGSAGRGTKTDWMMHEFRLPPNTNNTASTTPHYQEAEVWTICRIFKRNVSHANYKAYWSKSSKLGGISKTSNFESDDKEQCYQGFQTTDHPNQHAEKMSDVKQSSTEEKTQYQYEPSSTLQPALTPFFSCNNIIPNSNCSDFLRGGTLDELAAIVEFAFDPSALYGCTF